jgi:outer membrane protein
MLRSNLMASVLALSLACLAPLSAAQAEMKVGVVDFRRLLGESPQIKSLQATLDQEFDGRRRELLQLQSDLKAKDAKYQRDAAIMSEADKSKAQKELMDGQRDFTRKQNEFKEDAERRQNEELDKVQRVLALEVETFAKSQNFDMVIAKEVVLYRKDAVDVTSQIVAAIQAKAPKAAPAKP